MPTPKNRGEQEMDLVRGASMLLHQETAAAPDNDMTNVSRRRTQAFAFLSIFHPDLSLEDRLEMANEIARKDGK